MQRLAMHNGEHVPGRQQELAPTNNFEIPIQLNIFYEKGG